MKVTLLVMAFLFCLAGLFANPITAEVLSELWFTSEGHLMMEFCMNYPDNVYTVNLSDIHLINETADVTIPHAGAVSFDNPYVVDITSLLPDFTLNPVMDTLDIYFDNGQGFGGSTRYIWGNCQYSSITAIEPGQSAARVHTMNGYCFAKDEPPTPGTHPYSPVARDTLSIRVTDQNGNPVSGVPVREYIWWGLQYTNSDGIYSYSLPATKCYVEIRHPQNNAVVYAQSVNLEPNATTLINLIMHITANPDETIPFAEKGFKAYPNPFSSSMSGATGSVSFSYDGNAKLSGDSYIRIYDTKGHFITKVEMNSKGITSWQPSSDIASGLYLARLISGNRIVDTTTFTIMK